MKTLCHPSEFPAPHPGSNDCKSDISSCNYVNYITTSLAKYEKLLFILQETMQSYYGLLDDIPTILNNYNHFISSHHTTNDLEYIIKSKPITHTTCSSTTCPIFKRHYQRKLNTNVDSNITNTNDFKNDYLNTFCRNETDIANIQLLDKIHCHLYHSFDTGNRFNSNEQKEIENIIDEDEKMLKISQLSLTKQNKNIISPKSTKFTSFTSTTNAMDIDNVFNSDEIKSVRFAKTNDTDNYDINILDDYGEDTLTANEAEEEDEKQATTSPKSIKKSKKANNNDIDVYSLGQRWYYWQSFKYHKNYIQTKYKDLKEELIGNGIIKNINDFNQCYIKCNTLLNCNKSRQIMATNQILCVKYGVTCNSALTVYHILSILIYCSYINDIDKKNYQLTFAKLHKTETWKNVKLRHCKYGIWTKYLRECVEIFGHYLRDNLNKNEYFYHGISCQLLFPSTISKFCGPMSATKELSVILSQTSTELIIGFKSYETQDAIRYNFSNI